MHDALAVHLLHAAEEAPHELSHFAFGKVSVGLLDPVEKLSACEELQDNVDGVFGLVHSFQFEDVGV